MGCFGPVHRGVRFMHPASTYMPGESMCFFFFFFLKGNKLRQVWYHYFLVIFVLLVTAIGSSIFVTGKYLVEHPFEAPSLLASNMPKSTHFYLSSSPQGCVFDGPPGNCFSICCSQR